MSTHSTQPNALRTSREGNRRGFLPGGGRRNSFRALRRPIYSTSRHYRAPRIWRLKRVTAIRLVTGMLNARPCPYRATRIRPGPAQAIEVVFDGRASELVHPVSPCPHRRPPPTGHSGRLEHG